MKSSRQGQLFSVSFGPEDIICGIDEAGRGPLAGPVLAAAVVLPPGPPDPKLYGLTDSKLLSEEERERLFEAIQKTALAVEVERAEPEEIDRKNILRATLAAMSRAALRILPQPQVFLVDGNQKPDLPGSVHAIIGGDRIHAPISAASIIAKVTRDRIMKEYHLTWPEYGFARHKGYPTSEHLANLSRLGPCPIHRRSYAPVRACLENGTCAPDSLIEY